MIRRASSFDALRNSLSAVGLAQSALIEEHVAVALFNSFLLGRSQVWAEVTSGTARQRAETRSVERDRVLAVVLEPAFDPLPFEEAIEYFRAKNNLSPTAYGGLESAARAKAFTIAAGATRQARQSIMEILDEAQTDGVTLGEFQARANDIMDAAGLSERTPWYWETVYRTNLQTSYQAGRWQQMTHPDVAQERPYLRYVSALLPTTRPSHREKHGTVLPITDEFWRRWYPPNGFNCYCTVVSLSEREFQRDGLELSLKRFGFADPDDGFDTNPGLTESV